MKPGARDVPVPVKISGAELRELKKLTWVMAESFGLDRRVDAYQGRRPIRLHCWDLDCLVDVLGQALREAQSSPADSRLLRRLRDRLHELSEKVHEELKERQA